MIEKILDITDCHTYYTQQMAFTIWNNFAENLPVEKQVSGAIDYLIKIHDMDYERLWNTLNQTDKKVMIALSQNERNILTENFARKYSFKAISTVFSSLKRLMNQGYIIKANNYYQPDDIFFAKWIVIRRENMIG